MVTFKLEENTALTDEEQQLLAEAKKLPVVYDEDSPEMTDEMERAWIAARRAKPYRREPLTLYVAPDTIAKAKRMGGDYLTTLGKLLDKAVEEYRVS